MWLRIIGMMTVAVLLAAGVSALLGERDRAGASGAAPTLGVTTGPVASSVEWTESVRLTQPGVAAQDEFGASLAISGDTAVIGAPFIDGDTGRVYVFERNVGGADQWGLVAELRGSDGTRFDKFGMSVAIQGGTVLVGAPGEDPRDRLPGPMMIVPYAGAVYAFERNAGGANGWGEVQKLTAPDPGGLHDQRFGASVVIDGDTALIGAPDDDVGEVRDQGWVYVFERSAGTAGQWGRTARFTASDGAPFTNFGGSGSPIHEEGALALSGDTALVGVPGDSAVAGAAGAVYVFERDRGGANRWGQVVKLTASDAGAFDEFGTAVAIDGDAAVVGSPFDDDGEIGSGSAYLFDRNAGGANQWGEVRKLTASDAARGDWYGSSVALAGDTVLVGAPAADEGPNLDQGRVYVLERDASGADAWGEASRLTARDGVGEQRFGSGVAFAGETALVAAVYEDPRNVRPGIDEPIDETRVDSVYVFGTPVLRVQGSVYTGPDQSADVAFADATGIKAVWLFRDGGWLGFFPGTPLPPPFLRQYDALFVTALPDAAGAAGPALTVTPREVSLSAGPNIVGYMGAGGPIAAVVDAALLEAAPAVWLFRDGAWLGFFPAVPGISAVTDVRLGDLVFVALDALAVWVMG